MSMGAGSTAAIAREWRAHWRQGLAAFLTIGTSHGALNAASSLYVQPLQDAFGWSRGEIALAQNAALVSALMAPFVGRAVDRLGARWLMLPGMAVSLSVYLGLAAMNGSLLLYYALYVCLAIFGLTASGLTCGRVVSEYFVESRGFSLAVVRSGLALTSAVVPPALYAIIAGWSFRAGYLFQALLVGALAIPAVWAWVRPAASHARTDASARPPADGADQRGRTTLSLLRDSKVWLLCLGAGLGYAPANALLSQLQPLLVSKGLGGAEAAGLVGFAGMASLVGALVTGLLVDRLWAPAVALGFAVGSAAGTALLAANGSLDGTGAMLAVMLIGLGLGAEIDLVSFLVARYFGVRSFSSVYGITVFWIAASGALGASGLGLAYDRFGNYDAALVAISVSFLLSGLVYLMLGRYPRSSEPG